VPGGGVPARDPRLAVFGGDGRQDAPAPSGRLALLADEVSGTGRRCPGATGNELAGLLRAWAAVESWAAGAKLGVIAELIRRDETPPGAGRHGDLPDAWSPSLRHELAAALSCSAQSAETTAWLAWEQQARLPGTGALLGDGTLTPAKARAVTETFRYLTDADAARAEALILDQLAGKTYPQVLRLAGHAALAVDPGLAERRREQAQRKDARVTLFREQQGTAGLSGRDLPPDEALAAMASVNARAQDYEDCGAFGATPMDVLRAYAYLDLLNGVTPEARVACAEAQDEAAEAAEALAWAEARAAREARAAGARAGNETPARTGSASGTGAGCEAGAGATPAPDADADEIADDRLGGADQAGPRDCACDDRDDSCPPGGGCDDPACNGGNGPASDGTHAGERGDGNPAAGCRRRDGDDDDPGDDDPGDDDGGGGGGPWGGDRGPGGPGPGSPACGPGVRAAGRRCGRQPPHPGLRHQPRELRHRPRLRPAGADTPTSRRTRRSPARNGHRRAPRPPQPHHPGHRPARPRQPPPPQRPVDPHPARQPRPTRHHRPTRQGRPARRGRPAGQGQATGQSEPGRRLRHLDAHHPRRPAVHRAPRPGTH
jgi:hypothetical protein